MTKTRNRTLDMLRLLSAFAIICLHNFSGSGVAGAEETVAVTRFAVPFFFLASGYFSSGFDDKRRLRQLLRMALWAVLGHLLYLLIDLSRQPNDFLIRVRLHELFTPKSWQNLLLFNESPVSAHLWFLGALTYILALDFGLARLVKRLPRWVSWALAGLLLLGGLTGYQLLSRAPGVEFQLYYYRNFLWFGLPFFLIGKLIAGTTFGVGKLHPAVYPALIVAFCRLSIAAYRWLGPWELYLSSVALALLLLHLALSFPLSDFGGPVKVLAWLGKETSFTVYIIHIYFLDLLRTIYWEHLPWQYEFGVYHLIPLGVFILSVLAATLLAFARKGVRRLWARLRA